MRGTLIVRMFAVLAVLGLVASMAGPASAARPEKIDQTTSEPFPEEICGIPVTTTVTGFTILHIQDVIIPSTGEDSNDAWIGVIQDHLNVTWTNADGVTLTNTIRQTNQEGDFVDNGDGTWTYTFTIHGQPLKLRSGNQIVIMDVGSISFEAVFYLGDLSTTADDEFLGQVVTGITGPHPQAESDFELFCQLFTDIMG